MSRDLSHLVYVSRAAREMSETALQQLVTAASRRNRDRDVTGLLLYANGHFMQVLEGRLHGINELFGKIRHDPRHAVVRRLAFYPVRHRHFADWRMQLVNLDGNTELDVGQLRELLDAVARAPLGQLEGYEAVTEQLLDEFRRQMVPGGEAQDAA